MLIALVISPMRRAAVDAVAVAHLNSLNPVLKCFEHISMPLFPDRFGLMQTHIYLTHIHHATSLIWTPVGKT